jgi:mevalonate kinase
VSWMMNPDGASADAFGKAIVVGEHFVVYGTHAVAMPLPGLQTRVTVIPSSGLTVDAVGFSFEEMQPSIERAFQLIGVEDLSVGIHVESTVPTGCGLGSSAAYAVALIRALDAAYSCGMDPETINQMAFELEKIPHGNPSGIDNTVVAYESPLLFAHGKEPEPLSCAGRFSFLVADSGQRFPTSEAVGRVRQWRSANGLRFEGLCQLSQEVTEKAVVALRSGDPVALAPLLNESHRMLREIGASSETLDALVTASLDAGAIGAKLTGAGIGGSVIVLLNDASDRQSITSALLNAGARHVYFSEIGEGGA